MNTKFFILSFIFITTACANKNCREIRMEQEKQNPLSASDKIAKELQVGPLSKVKIFKYDGSRQCGMAEAIPLDKMQAELKNIRVYSAQNLPDGLMHIQACGTPTGRANVYEIDRKDLSTVKKLGFKEWVY